MALRVLGIDPPLAWAVLDVAAGKGTRLAHGTLDVALELSDLDAVVAEYQPALAGIELVREVYPRREKGGLSAAYATALYHTGVAAGEIRQRLKAAGLRVVTEEAEVVRKNLIGSVRGGGEGVMDRAVLQALLLRVTGWPRPGKPGERTSTNHERDAGLTALFVGLRELNDMLRATARRTG